MFSTEWLFKNNSFESKAVGKNPIQFEPDSTVRTACMFSFADMIRPRTHEIELETKKFVPCEQKRDLSSTSFQTNRLDEIAPDDSIL